MIRVLRVQVEEGRHLAGHENRVDPDLWRLLIMSFQHVCRLAEGV